MKTTLDQTTFLYQLIDGSPLKDAITGGVYKDWRPKESALEDIVVNAVTMEAGSVIQTGIANVNIHVPSLNTSAGKQPDHARMQVLTDMAKEILEQGNYSMHSFYAEGQNLIKEQGLEEWFINFRLRFTFHNTIINN